MRLELERAANFTRRREQATLLPFNWTTLTSRRRETGSPPAFPGAPGASIDDATDCSLPSSFRIFLAFLLCRDQRQRHRRNVGTNCCAPNRPTRHDRSDSAKLGNETGTHEVSSRAGAHRPPPPPPLDSGRLVPPPSAASASHRPGGSSRPVLFVPTTRRYNDRSMLNTQEGKRRSNMAAPVTAPRSPSSEDSESILSLGAAPRRDRDTRVDTHIHTHARRPRVRRGSSHEFESKFLQPLMQMRESSRRRD